LKVALTLSIVFALLAACAKEVSTVPVEEVKKASITVPFKAAPEKPVEDSQYRDPPPRALYMYVVKPGDWLSKIALAEYGDTTRWHWIYEWNRQKIGDNPAFIYPYREFQLYKPADEVEREDQLFGLHIVWKGETLWSIASVKYGDPRAWILIFHDNRATFPQGIGRMAIGTRLRIRRPLK